MRLIKILEKFALLADKKQRAMRLKFLILTIFAFAFLVGPTVLAQGLGNEYGASTGLTSADPRLIAAQIIRAALGIIGIIMLVIIGYAGFRIMTSQGQEEVVTKAKDMIKNAVIGLAIILASLAITQFIISKLNEAIIGTGAGDQTGVGAGFSPLSGALGGGIIKDHYPSRNAKDVPRNAKIIVTFKEPIKLSSVIKNYDDKNTPLDLSDDAVAKNNNNTPTDTTDDFFELNNEALEITSFLDGGAKSAPLASNEVKVYFTNSLENYTFVPAQPLGSPTANVSYEAHFIGGAKGVKKIDGSNAFDAQFGQGYAWSFEVSTALDLTPPKILSRFPTATGCPDKVGGICPPNTTIQVTYDEAMDPVTTSGQSGGFTNITVVQGSSAVNGEFVLTNGYRTVVFTPSTECGLNSCGGKVYCLPTGATPITTTVKAATLSPTPPQADLPYPFDGVTDIAGNSLDGDGDGKAEGPSTDNASWNFNVNGALDLTPPEVLSTAPSLETGNIDPSAPLMVNFSKVLDPSSISSETVTLSGALASDNYTPKQSLVPWYVLKSVLIYHPAGQIVEGTVTKPANNIIVTRLALEHGLFVDDASYYPNITEGLKDVYQNCFYPSQSLNCAADLSNPFCCNVSKCANGCTISTTTGEPICKP